MGRFCNGVMATFRVLKLILSLAALGCGAFITYTMLSMAESARQVESSIQLLLDPAKRKELEDSSGSVFTDLDLSDSDVQDFAETLDTVLTPLLRILQGFPVRAVVLTAVSVWSTCAIIYVLVAQRKSSKNPRLNKKSIRVSLDLLTVVLWIVGISCAVLLAIQYGAIVMVGGVQMRLAFATVKPLIKTLLKQLIQEGDALRALSIVDDLFVIGILSILAVISACVCGVVSFVSLMATCCISGKPKKKDNPSGLESGAAEYLISPPMEKQPGVSVTQVFVTDSMPHIEGGRLPASRQWRQQ